MTDEYGPLLMTISEEAAGDRRLWFGRIPDGLHQVDLGDNSIPYTATFILEGGTIEAYVNTVVPAFDGDSRPRVELVRIESPDGGSSWGSPSRVLTLSETVRSLHALRDASGALHLLWTEEMVNERHAIRAPESREWSLVSIPPPADGMALGGVVGVDRCGQLTFVRHVLLASRELVLQGLRYVDGTWRNTGTFDDFAGTELFDGTASDGAWIIGWTGARIDAGRPPALDVWLAAP